MQALPPLTLNPDLDVAALRHIYARTGRVTIRDWLPIDAAVMLATLLRERSDWRQILNSGEKALELTRDARAQLSSAQYTALENAVYGAARYGFQYRYETIRVPDAKKERQMSTDMLCRFAEWMSSEPVCALLRQITQDEDICFADAQATAYSPGDFLTGHDDAVPGKNRRAAYVMGLTAQWRPEWGGLLLFHDSDEIAEARPPQYNVLNLFRVPQIHSVTEVTKAAAYRRYSITGWLRSQQP
ncbi:2OG-Fe(II) oxygenase family protein [Sphingobium sp.]|uniref:2OG-Fe(II) oxygenase n=1 Tax=Sphingobium sp. TaxID=1912891 RepID=UPI0026258944|nr:2OG-Fe(II) oxygenase family protein [Sphingobium sp.]